MARFQRRRTFRGSSPRRKRQWARELTTASLAAGTVSRHDVLNPYKLDAGITNLGGHTAVRTLVDTATNWAVAPDPISDFIAYGLKVESVNQTAPFTGTGPVAGEHSDWLWWDICSPGEGAGGSTTKAFCHFDLKSKRKIEELDQSIFLYILSPNVAAATRVTVSTLLLLP